MEFKTFNVNKLELVASIYKELGRQNPKLPLESALYNKVIEVANLIALECKRERVYATSHMTPQTWINSDDVGSSSRYMLAALTNPSPTPDGATPCNALDLGRCIRMVKACGLESEIPRLFELGYDWNRIAKNWEKLKTLYEEKEFGDIYDFLHCER
jgi:hypothetical protein